MHRAFPNNRWYTTVDLFNKFAVNHVSKSRLFSLIYGPFYEVRSGDDVWVLLQSIIPTYSIPNPLFHAFSD